MKLKRNHNKKNVGDKLSRKHNIKWKKMFIFYYLFSHRFGRLYSNESIASPENVTSTTTHNFYEQWFIIELKWLRLSKICC